MRSKAVVAYFKVLVQHSPGGSEENNKTISVRMAFPGPGFEFRTSIIRNGTRLRR